MMSAGVRATSTRVGAVTKDSYKVCLDRLHEEKSEVWRVQRPKTKAAAAQWLNTVMHIKARVPVLCMPMLCSVDAVARRPK